MNYITFARYDTTNLGTYMMVIGFEQQQAKFVYFNIKDNSISLLFYKIGNQIDKSVQQYIMISIKLTMPGKKHQNPSYEPLLREKNQFRARVQFNDSQISFQFQGMLSSDTFEVDIIQADIDKIAVLQLVFGNTEALFLALRNNFDLVIIKQGVISLEVTLEMMGRISKKMVTFYGRKLDVSDTATLASLSQQLNRTMSQFNTNSQHSLQKIRNEAMNLHQIVFKEAPPPVKNYNFQHPPSPQVQPKQVRNSILPISQERIVRSPTIIEKKERSNLSQACKCSIM